MAERLGHDLAKRGLVIVSGLARGVDALSVPCRGNCGRRGKPFGVMGQELMCTIPRRIRDCLKKGAIINELPTGSHLAPENFPVSNRLIAGMPKELPTPIRAALVQAEAVESEQQNALAAEGLSQTEKRLYALLGVEEPKHIEDLVETTGLNSSEVLATLSDLEMKASYGICRESSSQRSCCMFRKAHVKPARCIRGSASRIRNWSPVA
jgi:predicted Rossmann fold nucleotide-binding protein DprA/Smf involved in DNA uptake